MYYGSPPVYFESILFGCFYISYAQLVQRSDLEHSTQRMFSRLDLAPSYAKSKVKEMHLR